MDRMLDALGQRRYARASLTVQKKNYAPRMYQAAGFETVDENDEEYSMANRLG